eukprot:TRINITY_DN25596_c0_g1_i1.p1 TRINITY_DN25596_c0_g1~~TRINITY_DN25596_c0_g1_i1.p1  ORF type:complete len:107 (+),score=34.86 TRINITY_DN25596_c0_g1_i1:43-321(+)
MCIRDSLKKPVKLGIGQTNQLNAARSVQQIVEVVSESDKLARLLSILSEHGHAAGVAPTSKALVFVNTKKGAARLSEHLCASGVLADALHGD